VDKLAEGEVEMRRVLDADGRDAVMGIVGLALIVVAFVIFVVGMAL
jgi:hypothetical protein